MAGWEDRSDPGGDYKPGSHYHHSHPAHTRRYRLHVSTGVISDLSVVRTGDSVGNRNW